MVVAYVENPQDIGEGAAIIAGDDQHIVFGVSESVRELANVSAAYGVKIVELYTDDRYDNTLTESRKRRDVIRKLATREKPRSIPISSESTV